MSDRQTLKIPESKSMTPKPNPFEKVSLSAIVPVLTIILMGATTLNIQAEGLLTGDLPAVDNSTWSSPATQEWTPVPEPTPAALVGGVGVLVLLRRRRSC